MSKTNFMNERVAIIQAGWHKEISDVALKTFQAEMTRADFPSANMEIFHVPGSLEIPLQAKLLAKTGRFDAIVSFGFIIDGGIYHHEYVNHAVIDGMMRVSLDTEIPVLSVVLTPHHFHETEPHQKFFEDHFKVKGVEAAHACLQSLENMRALKPMRKAA